MFKNYTCFVNVMRKKRVVSLCPTVNRNPQREEASKFTSTIGQLINTYTFIHTLLCVKYDVLLLIEKVSSLIETFMTPDSRTEATDDFFQTGQVSRKPLCLSQTFLLIG